MHWSPADACRAAAKLLNPRASDRVLDVGSGVGKFCVLGSLAHRGHFVGVEQRDDLVEEANAVAAHFKAERASFILGDALELDWSGFDGFYFYNPFGELRFDMTRRIDHTVTYDPAKHRQSVITVRNKLLAMPAGTKVVLHHGFGGRLPDKYELTQVEPLDEGDLELWVKRGVRRS
ncbi:MAG: methyltransferase domain-containing protein [Myxococcaceae bacterium]